MVDDSALDILNSLPTTILADRLDVTQQIINKWKRDQKIPKEYYERRLLRLADLAKRVADGSYEGFIDPNKNQIRIIVNNFNPSSKLPILFTCLHTDGMSK